jgi:hypothetical protein
LRTSVTVDEQENKEAIVDKKPKEQDCPLKLTLGGSVKTEITTSLRGPERGLLIMALLWVTVLGMSSLVYIISSSAVAGAGCVLALIGMVAVLIRWWQSGPDANRNDLPSTEIRCGDLSISAHISDPSERAELMQMLLEGRLALGALDSRPASPRGRPEAGPGIQDQSRLAGRSDLQTKS